ncbi:MAG: BON domain-containing protein [Bdellovibrionales bacterium]|nr:BON domain-containing protein [Bdellovibrionales bacterium]
MKRLMSLAISSAFLAATTATAVAKDSNQATARASMEDSAHMKNSKKERQSDTWLEAKLVTTIALNRHLSIFDISTDVKNQTAYLSGVVESDIEKDLAGEVAKSIDGIKSVKNNILVDKTKARAEVEKLKSSEEYSFVQKIDDLTTTAAIKSKLIADSNVSGFAVDIDTMHGNVTLKGKVQTSEQKALIEQIAKNTAGVKDVDNKLNVQ